MHDFSQNSVAGTIVPDSIAGPPGAHLAELKGLNLARARKKRHPTLATLLALTIVYGLQSLNSFPILIQTVNAQVCDAGYFISTSPLANTCKICPAGKLFFSSCLDCLSLHFSRKDLKKYLLLILIVHILIVSNRIYVCSSSVTINIFNRYDNDNFYRVPCQSNCR